MMGVVLPEDKNKLTCKKGLRPAARAGTLGRVRNAITIGLIRGESYYKMSKNIGDVMGFSVDGKWTGKGESYKAVRIARTEGQRARVAGQMEALKRAKENGIDVHGVWDATLDMKTREAHGAMDGKKADEEGMFYHPSVGRFPGPLHSWVASFDINCRCSVRQELKGFPPKKRFTRGDGEIPWVSYEEWRKGVESGKYKNPDRPTAKFKKIKGEHSVKDDLKATNPRFEEAVKTNNPRWTHNCQRCVSAYEARRRGYDVTAKSKWKKRDPLSFANSRGWPSVYKDYDLMRLNKETPEEVKQQIESCLEKWGDGSRAIVGVIWNREGYGGHVFIAEQIRGKTMFVDPQTNNMDVSGYFSHCKPEHTMLMRVDNLEFTDKIKMCCK